MAALEHPLDAPEEADRGGAGRRRSRFPAESGLAGGLAHALALIEQVRRESVQSVDHVGFPVDEEGGRPN
jgi:hypothetical protein